MSSPSLPKKMKAMGVKAFGEPIQELTFDVPEPGEGEILVRIRAAGANPVDVSQTTVHPFGGDLPLIPGWDLAGEVVKCGLGANRFPEGTKVWAYIRRMRNQFGTYAEYVTFPECFAAEMPEKMTFSDAAGFPLAGLTAMQGLIKCGLTVGAKNFTVLVLGGSGGVGGFAVQLAKRHFGAKVLATCSSANMDYVTSLGADTVIDYTKENVQARLKTLVPGGLDAVFDAVGDEVTLSAAVKNLKKGHQCISIAAWGIRNKFDNNPNYKFDMFVVVPHAPQLETLRRLFGEGKLKLPNIERFSLSDAPKVFEMLMSKRTKGKLVLEI